MQANNSWTRKSTHHSVGHDLHNYIEEKNIDIITPQFFLLTTIFSPHWVGHILKGHAINICVPFGPILCLIVSILWVLSRNQLFGFVYVLYFIFVFHFLINLLIITLSILLLFLVLFCCFSSNLLTWICILVGRLYF